MRSRSLPTSLYSIHIYMIVTLVSLPMKSSSAHTNDKVVCTKVRQHNYLYYHLGGMARGLLTLIEFSTLELRISAFAFRR